MVILSLDANRKYGVNYRENGLGIREFRKPGDSKDAGLKMSSVQYIPGNC